MELNFSSVRDMIDKLKVRTTTEQSKLMTKFYTKIRFGQDFDFERYYVDGSNDGGVDLYFSPDEKYYYVLQSKFSANPSKISSSEVKRELDKILKTLFVSNLNNKIGIDFMTSLKNDKNNSDSIISINWLTTNQFAGGVFEEAETFINSFKTENSIAAVIEFIPVDREFIERAIYDNTHGFVPLTGRKEITIPNGIIHEKDTATKINSVVCKANLSDILSWFKDFYDIKNYLQKNVRGFIGSEKSDTEINKAIAASFTKAPEYFWYKHNGIVLFVDHLRIIETDKKLILLNPQIVNGGQTISKIYSEWCKQGKVDNGAKIIARIYRQSYDDVQTYERTIDIVAALNSQNKVFAYDLRSNDPVQVKIERLLSEFTAYQYKRKRGKDIKSSEFGIRMPELAKIFHCCLLGRPDIAARGNTDDLFKNRETYVKIFDDEKLDRPLSIVHQIVNYVTAWEIYWAIKKLRLTSAKDKEYFEYTKYYLIWKIYNSTQDWRKNNLQLDYSKWLKFMQSNQFKTALRDSAKPLLKTLTQLKPEDITAKKYFRTEEAVKPFAARTKNYKINFDKPLKKFESISSI